MAPGGEVEYPGEATGATSDAVVLSEAHHDHKSKLETLAVGAGLALVACFARPAKVKVPGLEGSVAVGDLDGSVAVNALEPNESKPFFCVVGSSPEHFVNDLGAAARDFLFADDAKVQLGELEGLDDTVSPGKGNYDISIRASK